MADPIFEHPRLVSIYDAMDPDRSDLDPYLAMVQDFAVRRVMDLGCGTGVLALQLAERGIDVVGVDPAAGSLAAARAKPGGSGVRWIHGNATALPPMQVDLVLMTGNAAQAITEEQDWSATLDGVRAAVKPLGRFVFETRDPARRAWEEWTETASRGTAAVEGVGDVESWVELLDATWPLVSFRWTYIFASDGQVLTSDSTLRFREQNEVEHDLNAHGFDVESVREAADRPGRELVFVARKSG
ncbi:class I SAM-dependent methyltransferase [Arthrobacter sp. Br18]|uniref:class I SAM-dependent methyltransferase n=1 Tax=Arthrobacter sp. Br18 TaxID=1312954 RepID=UPI00047D522F|nr:class I SAM-dependent methyltransferase [Arthrobacter sp. Br18]